MTPNFALSLSFDGIRLLQRVTDGWHLVGEVALDVDDLPGALKALRARADALAPEGIQTKILIPNEQIKYTAIDTTRTELSDIHAALDGATPYAISELEIDFDRTGGRTHIAAVAIETLAEAESFAIEHNFNPVCFAAIAEPFTFRSEVFFGMTAAAKRDLPPGTEIARDDAPVAVTGMVEDHMPQPEVAAPEADDVPLPTFKRRAAELEASVPEPKKTAAAPADDVQKVANGADDDALETTGEDITFAPRARETVENAPKVSKLAPPDVEPLFTRRKEPLLTTADVGDAPPIAAPTTPPVAAPPVAEIPKAPPEVPVATAATPAPEPAKVKPTKRRAAKPKVDAEKEKLTVFGARKSARVGGKPRYLGLILTVLLLVFMALVAMWANTLSEDGIAGWFKGDASPDVEIVVAPETVTTTPFTADPITPEPVEVVTVIAPADETPAVLPAQESPAGTLPIVREPTGRVLSPAEADRIYAATGVYQRAPRMNALPRETTLDAMQAALSLPRYSTKSAPQLPDFAAVFPDNALPTQLNPPTADTRYQRDLRGFILAMPDGTLTPDGVLIYAGSPDILPPPRPGTEPAVAVIAAPQVIPDDIVEGLRLVAGPPPILPRDRPEGLAPEIEAAQQPAPDLAPLAPDAIAEAIVPPLDAAEGLNIINARPARVPPLRPESFAALIPISAEPEAAVAIEVAEAAPTDAALVVNPSDAVAQNGVPLSEVKPLARPAGLAPDVTEVAALFSDPDLADARPRQRPAGLAPAPDVVVAAATPDLNSVIAAIAETAPTGAIVTPTARAITLSPRPDRRPQNFARLVASARERIALQQASVAVSTRTAPTTQVTSSPARPSGPVPGSVAQAATMDGAISLRELNLIGVYGRASDRRALVRLSNGRYVKVEVGSALDGGQVTAIGEAALNYVKRGRTYALELPSG